MRIAALALVSAAALVLVGCTPAPHPTSSPKPAATPVFRTDAEALAAAEKAYRAYEAASDQIFADGGKDPSRLDHFATGKVLADDRRDFAELVEKGWRSVGRTRVTNVTLESHEKDAVTIYACDDVSGVDVLDSRGASVVSQDRPDLSPVEVSLKLRDTELLVAAINAWDGGGVC
jgi:hypothetical protein